MPVPVVNLVVIDFLDRLKYFPDLMKEFSEKHGGGQMKEVKETEVKKEVEVKAEVIEKKNFDVELTGIDASKKLMIIKEFKTIFSLGLKEAKDMVEKPPVVLKKAVPKEEAEILKGKLEALGCVVNLK